MASMQSRLERVERSERAVAARSRAAVATLVRPAVPLNIVDFVTSPAFLNRVLYPKQATILKIIALERSSFTLHDYETTEAWAGGFEINEAAAAYVGDWGITNDVFERMDECRASGAPCFNEVALVFGRRAGKTQLVAYLVAWRIWKLLLLGDPQAHYAMPASKAIGIHLYSVNYDAVRRDVFADVEALLTDAPCFAPFLGKRTGGRVTILTPAQVAVGKRGPRSVGLIDVRAAPTTATAGRGAAVAMVVFDEIAHVNGQGSNADSVALSQAVTPGLAQFGADKMIIHSSSPWEQTGALYQAYTRALALDPTSIRPDEPTNAASPTTIAVQLMSWDPYLDWEKAHTIDMWDGGPKFAKLARAHITADDPLLVEERRFNPERFAVEYEGKFRTSRFAYMTPETVDSVFAPFNGAKLVMQHRATVGNFVYVGHADPAKTHANFAFAVGHTERDARGLAHVVFDLLHVWRPQDYEGKLYYPMIERAVVGWAKAFKLSTFTMDQYNSIGFLDHVRDELRSAYPGMRPQVFERTADRNHNWRAAETFKQLAAQGRIHAPYLQLARDELAYLQERHDKVFAPSSGPTQTKDLFDAMINVVHTLTTNDNGKFHELANVALGAYGSRNTFASGRPASDPVMSRLFSQAFGPSAPVWHSGHASRAINPNRRPHP